MIIDTHTHIFPDKIASRTLEILSGNAKKIWNRTAIPQTDGKLNGIKEAMAGHGVGASVILPIATTIKQSGSINKFASQINGVDNIYSLGSLHPMQTDWEETLYQIKELGLKGIKLHPEYQSFYVTSPECIRILQKCEELDLIVYFHAGEDVGIDLPVHSTPIMFKELLNHISGKKVVLAHMGGWQQWDDVEKHLVGTSYHFDTAYCLSEMRIAQTARIISKHGSHKILFGTDSPWHNATETISMVNNLPISQEDRDNIFYKNAKKLFNI
ncbi:MAG: amidohydrolase family protein [Clostridia bacterium]|nr:amidohydrolase family protein [Clostridia bacterium]